MTTTTSQVNVLLVKIGTEPGLEKIPLILKSYDSRIRTFGILNHPQQEHNYDVAVTSTQQAVLGAHSEYLCHSLYVRPELFERLAKDEGRILRMYDRVAIHDLQSVDAPSAPIPRFDNSLDARSQLFLRQAAYWDYVIETFSLHAVVAQNYGHNGWDAVLQAVAEARDIPYLFFHEVRPFLGSLFVHESVSDLGSTELGRTLLNMSIDGVHMIPDSSVRANRLRNQVLGTPITSTVDSLKKETQSCTPLRRAILLCRELKNPSGFLKRRLRAYGRRKSNRRSMRDEETSWSKQPLSKDYIFCELQSQPNGTTAIKVSEFADQRESIAMVAKNLPHGWTLVVKESDRQWSRMYPRRQNFWSQIAHIPNVHIVPYTSTSRTLALGARAVLESSYSSLALDAIRNMVPVLIFGKTHIGSLPGVYRIRTDSDLQRALEHISSPDFSLGDSANLQEHLRRFADVVREATLEGALSSQPRNLSPLEYDEYFNRVNSNVARVIFAWLKIRKIA